MDFSASAATKDAARTWRRRSCTPPRFSSTLPDKRGLPGGVEGGVPGGVPGGIIGGLPSEIPPPPPPPPPQVERGPIRTGV